MNKSGLFSNRYSYFLEVAKTGNFHKASEKLFVSQPAVSQQIKTLENELGYPLLYRTTQGVMLTQEGKIIYNALTECMDILNEAERKIQIQKKRGSNGGAFRIGMLTNWTLDKFDRPYFTGFFQKYPEISPFLVRDNPDTLLEQLEINTLDVVVAPLNVVCNMPKLSWVSLGSYPFVLILSRNHPLAKCENVMDRLDEITLYTHQKEGAHAVAARFAKTGHHPRIIMTANIDSKVAAAENGLGGAIVLSCSRETDNPALMAYPLKELSSEIVVAYKNLETDLKTAMLVDYILSLKK